MRWRAISYYTKDSIYEQIAQTLIESATKFNIPLTVYEFQSAGSWFANCHFKSDCILQAMDDFKDTEFIIFVDGDAVFKCYPALFDIYDYDLACLWLQWYDMYPQNQEPDAKEKAEATGKILSNGTIWMRNTPEVKAYIEEWDVRLKENPELYEQASFQDMYGRAWDEGKIRCADSLPPEYCMVCLDGKPIDESVPYENVIIEHGRSTREMMDSVK
jgi:hypothetical protein